MARKKWVINERFKRTPEERKWVEEQLNRERTPEELKKAILGKVRHYISWNVWFDKRIGARLLVGTGDEIYYKEADEEGEYANSHFSEIKRGFIDIIKQNPQNWEIGERKVYDDMFEGIPKNERKLKDLAVEEKEIGGKCHYKNGFTKEEWAEIENALNNQKQTDLEQPNNYENLTKEQFVTEINRLKVEIERLENNKNTNSSELQKKKESLKKLEQMLEEGNDKKPKIDNNFPTSLIVGGVVFMVGEDW